jgi:hypothetical protein
MRSLMLADLSVVEEIKILTMSSVFERNEVPLPAARALKMYLCAL